MAKEFNKYTNSMSSIQIQMGVVVRNDEADEIFFVNHYENGLTAVN